MEPKPKIKPFPVHLPERNHQLPEGYPDGSSSGSGFAASICFPGGIADEAVRRLLREHRSSA